MKRLLMIILFTCACLELRAQVNFVLNPSLENDTACPYAYDQIFFANYWQSLDTLYVPDSAAYYGLCAAEYCNVCATYYDITIPSAARYYQYPRTGNGMAQVQMFANGTTGLPYPDYRDYLQGHLYKILTAGKSYCVTYYVNLTEASGFAINHIDAFLDDGTIDTAGYYCGVPNMAIIPQIVETDIITDTMNWVKIQGSFISNGTERFITITDFKDSAHTAKSAVTYPSGAGGQFTWYLVDDVSVIESDNIPFAGNDTAIHTSDSIFLGPHEIALPYTWYVLGNSTAIDSGGGIWVRPDSTTSYVLEQNLCGMLTYDTVKVTVGNLNAGNVINVENVKIYPNPAHDELSIGLTPALSSGAGVTLQIYNVVGQEVYSTAVKNEREQVNISQLRNGTYLLQVIASDGGRKSMTVVKE